MAIFPASPATPSAEEEPGQLGAGSTLTVRSKASYREEEIDAGPLFSVLYPCKFILFTSCLNLASLRIALKIGSIATDTIPLSCSANALSSHVNAASFLPNRAYACAML